jgi:hypothetical protein
MAPLFNKRFNSVLTVGSAQSVCSDSAITTSSAAIGLFFHNTSITMASASLICISITSVNVY